MAEKQAKEEAERQAKAQAEQAAKDKAAKAITFKAARKQAEIDRQGYMYSDEDDEELELTKKPVMGPAEAKPKAPEEVIDMAPAEAEPEEPVVHTVPTFDGTEA